MPRAAVVGRPGHAAVRRKLDRRWFVATEIDYPWTYVAGPRALVDAVVRHPDVEAVPIQHDDPW